MNRPFGDLPHEPCCLLRWKSMFIEVEPDPTVPASNEQIYWCSQTQVCVGPDGQVAAPRDCHPARSCYSDTV